MKIRFLEDTFIRGNLSLPVAEPIGIIYKGALVNVEEKMHIAAFTIGNNDQWYRDGNGWYYWSGGAEIVPADSSAGTSTLVEGGVTPSAPTAPAPPAPPAPPVVVVMPEQPPPMVVNVPPPPSPPPPPSQTLQSVVVNIPAAPPPIVVNVPESGSISAEPLEGSVPPVVAVIPPGPETGQNPVDSLLFLDPTDAPDNSSIPDGETRFVPADRGSSPDMLAAPGMARGLESIRVTPEQEVFRSEPEPPVDWERLNTTALNWGIQHAGLSRDWWQQRRVTGRGVKLALLSTGADPTHPDLAGHAKNSFSVFAGAQGAFADRDGLGTQAAVIAAGRGKLSFGVAPEATLLIGQLGQYDRDITPVNLLAGLNWALDNGAEVVGLLVDFRELSEADKEALKLVVNRAVERNVWLVAPVGNSAERRPELRYPAALEGVLCVGAHDAYGKRSAFSAKSYQLDLLAPGEGLLTSNLQRQLVDNLKNTAIAAAYMAGFLALLRQLDREQSHLNTPAALFELLRGTAKANNTITRGDDVEYGFGILDPAALLTQL